jgi:hypothetical protein
MENETLYLKYKNLIMKKIFFLTFVLCILCLSQDINAQKIFSTDADYKADFKVYVVDADYKADLLVYKVDSDYQADGNEGKWYFTDADYKADKKIFFVNADYKADLLIHFANSDYKAGWKKREKMYLLY